MSLQLFFFNKKAVIKKKSPKTYLWHGHFHSSSVIWDAQVTYPNAWFKSKPLYLQSSNLLTHARRQKVITQVLRFLPAIWERRTELLGPGCDLAHTSLLWSFGIQISGWKVLLSLSHSFSLALQCLPFPLSFFQVKSIEAKIWNICVRSWELHFLLPAA